MKVFLMWNMVVVNIRDAAREFHSLYHRHYDDFLVILQIIQHSIASRNYTCSFNSFLICPFGCREPLVDDYVMDLRKDF